MGQGRLSRGELLADPVEQFWVWWKEAVQAGQPEPSSVALATASTDGRPSLRHVLLKKADADGFLFMTDVRSRKGRELSANPRAAMCFWWATLARQVTVEGEVVRAKAEEADAYFQGRQRESQLSSWASLQGEPLADREELERDVEAVAQRFAEESLPTPAHWVGFRLQPTRIEFWQRGAHRRHDRFSYSLDGPSWIITRLSP